MDNAQALSALTELALDLRWAWNHAADELWGQLDPELWEVSRNAWLVLQTLSPEKKQAVLDNPEFGRRLDELIRDKRERALTPRWFQKTWAESPMSAVAYFSMEFMLSDALPIYAGGLGNVAGDQLKAASDLGVPVVGVGLLYQQGYFRQRIDADGRQQAFYPFNDPRQMPVTPVLETNGEWLRIAIDLPGFKLWIRAWQVQVGRISLYLLDTNDPANLPEYRGITSELYGGEAVLRLRQEQVLGIGGWRLLRALGIRPEVCHLNEGHAALAILERARSYMEDAHQPFDVAFAVTRAGNIFTTHTAVEAGFDRFSPQLMEHHLKNYAESGLGIPFGKLLALGRVDPADDLEPFNMAYLAMRGAGAVNGVSRLHGEVSQGIFQELYPRWPKSEVPVSHVTNGIHVPTWDSPEADELWTTACGKGRWRHDLEGVGERLRAVPEAELWKMRTTQRKSLIAYVRQRLARQLAGHGASPEEVLHAGRIFDPDILTIGFARRFATYKRPNLLLRNPERLLRILTNRQRPVQLILAGKAHPRDGAGQEMIRQWIQFIRQPPARAQAVFLSDYDMHLTEHLVQGVDLWLNTPRRPWEASGTSGMKVLVNGGLNLSELDGWWAEAYSPDTGWAIGDGLEHGDDPALDDVEAEQLYTLLEQRIVPAFYRRDEAGVPTEWTAKMRESMARLTPQFSSNRSVQAYTKSYYTAAARAFRERSDNGGESGAKIAHWQQHIAEHWPRLRFGSMRVETEGGRHRFQVQAYLDELDSDALCVELFAQPSGNGEPVRHPMARGQALIGAENAWSYTASVAADRPAEDFTPRIIPAHPGASIPLEAQQILWFK